MRRFLVRICALVGLAVVGLFTSLSASYADTPLPPIQLGSILILTGEGAAAGTASRRGIDMAVEKINREGGVQGRQLVVNHQDDHGDPKISIGAFRDLTTIHGIHYVIGPTWSHLAAPLIPLALRSKTVMISPTLGVASFNEAHKYLFNTWPHDEILSKELAHYVYRKGHRNVALIGAEHVWVKEQTTAFKKQFEALGGKVAFMAEPLPGTSDLRAEALRIRGLTSIDALVSTTDGVIVGSLLAKSLKENGVSLPTYSITLDQKAIDASQGGFEGMEFLTFLTPSAEFQAAYEARYKEPIDIGADSAYDAVMMLAEAMKRAGSFDPDAVAAELGAVTRYKGVSGSLVSDGKRGFTKAFVVKKIATGRPQDLGGQESSANLFHHTARAQ